MTSDWEEIQRLAADFQKVQLTSTLQKYNINIVSLVLVIYTKHGILDFQKGIALKLLHYLLRKG